MIAGENSPEFPHAIVLGHEKQIFIPVVSDYWGLGNNSFAGWFGKYQASYEDGKLLFREVDMY